MSNRAAILNFAGRDFKGSRLRCLLATHQERAEVAKFLTTLVTPHAVVSLGDQWAPRGFTEPDEAKLGETEGFLNDRDREEITKWWLAKPGRANTPNWDLMSECRIDEERGLILVEAKAHEGEFGKDRGGAKDPENTRRIEEALRKASEGWNELVPGISLSAKSHYQLSNRFAVAWKVASMGTPVILVYLGFLDANEMDDGRRKLLRSHDQWENCVKRKAAGVVPEGAWNRTFPVNGTPVTVLIRSARVDVKAVVAG